MLSGLNPFWALVLSLVARFTKLVSGNRNIIDLHGNIFYEYRNYGWKLRSYAYYILEFMMLKLSDVVIVASEGLKKFVINAFGIPH
jgi:hypothetical protein